MVQVASTVYIELDPDMATDGKHTVGTKRVFFVQPGWHGDGQTWREGRKGREKLNKRPAHRDRMLPSQTKTKTKTERISFCATKTFTVNHEVIYKHSIRSNNCYRKRDYLSLFIDLSL